MTGPCAADDGGGYEHVAVCVTGEPSKDWRSWDELDDIDVTETHLVRAGELLVRRGESPPPGPWVKADAGLDDFDLYCRSDGQDAEDPASPPSGAAVMHDVKPGVVAPNAVFCSQGRRTTPTEVEGPFKVAPRYQGVGGQGPQPTTTRTLLAESGPRGRRRITVGVIDTGVGQGRYASRPLERFLTPRCLVSSDTEDHPDADRDGMLDPVAGHGTLVASVIARAEPQVVIEAVRAVDRQGAVSDLGLACAIDKLCEILGRAPDVLNLSLGGYTHDGAPAPAVASRLRALHADGTAIVAAAGNLASNRPFWPAAMTSEVISVGGTVPDGRGGWVPASYSNHGTWVTAAVEARPIPGWFFGSFESAPDPGVKGQARLKFTGEAEWDGTSFLAPQVAGLLCRMLIEDEDLDPQGARRRLFERYAGVQVDGMPNAVLLTQDTLRERPRGRGREDVPRKARPLRRGPNARDVQGNVLAAFNKPHATYLLVSLPEDPEAARAWVAELAPLVSTTEEVEDFYERRRDRLAPETRGDSRPPRDGADGLAASWIGVGLTWSGLTALAPQRDLARDLAPHRAFRVGPAARAEDLGDDVGDWLFGAEDATRPVIDAVVTVAADNRDDLRRRREQVLALGERHGAELVFEQPCALLPGKLRGHEHFGFKDGISQPAVHQFHEPEPARPDQRRNHPGQLLVEPGEFVLGWEREGADAEAVPDWLRNASFQVVRRVDQDVKAWNVAARKAAGQARERQRRWGAALVGRSEDGAPLASPGAPGGEAFDYADDPDGRITPRFAHIRKVHPRGVAAFEPRRHRLMRRGIPFGPPFEDGDEDAERGMMFIGFMASIEGQFEYVQRLFANKPDFPQDRVGPDPLIGRVDSVAGYGEDDEFDGPQGFRRAPSLTPFVRTRGAVYALAPSKHALEWLGRGGPADATAS